MTSFSHWHFQFLSLTTFETGSQPCRCCWIHGSFCIANYISETIRTASEFRIVKQLLRYPLATFSWQKVSVSRRGGAKGACPPFWAWPPLPPPPSSVSRTLVTKRRAIMRCSSTGYHARFNNSNLLLLQLRNYLTLYASIIKDNRAKLLKDGYCSTVAYC